MSVHTEPGMGKRCSGRGVYAVRLTNLFTCMVQEKNEALRAAAAAANKGGSANEARLQDREQYISSLQVGQPLIPKAMPLACGLILSTVIV